MSERRPGGDRQTSVIHCFRPLVGGVFRHVVDLATGQAQRGAVVGVICAAGAAGERADAQLAALADLCTLGVHRLPIRRRLHWSDYGTQRRIARICARLAPDVVHGHGAKGGAFARLLPGRLGARIVYTPHGGVLHYEAASLAGRYYFALERFLARSTDGLIFASRFGAAQYAAKIGAGHIPQEVIHNGLHAADFVDLDDSTPSHDFVFAGELRMLKGLDTLLRALAVVRRERPATLLVHGAGPDAAFFHARVRELGLEGAVEHRPPAFPVVEAFARGRVVVVPSHAESFPYIVLEALAAGTRLIATRAGGIPEIFGPHAHRLVAPGDADELAAAMAAALSDDGDAAQAARDLAERVRSRFRVDGMVDASLDFYRRVLGRS